MRILHLALEHKLRDVEPDTGRESFTERPLLRGLLLQENAAEESIEVKVALRDGLVL